MPIVRRSKQQEKYEDLRKICELHEVKTEIKNENLCDLNESVDEKIPEIKNVIRWQRRSLIESVKELDKHRKNVTEVLLWSNATLFRSRSDLGYLCYFCKEQYLEPADLKRHNIKDHAKDITVEAFKKHRDLQKFSMKLDITDLKCNICYKSIKSLQDLFDHLINEHGKSFFTDVKNHIIPFKFDTKMFHCAICSIEISTFKSLHEHMHKHLRNFICDICDAGFINRGGLYNHLDRHNLGMFSCQHCNKVFVTKRRKLAHELSVHVHANLRNKCRYCDEKFTNLRKKELHMEKVHGAKSVAAKCQACDKILVNRDALRLHIKRHHLMEKSHECPECDMKFFAHSSLKIHMVKHSKIREFQCQVCCKRYGRKKTLVEHLRIHANDRRYKCEFCGMAFVQKCSLTGHLRSKHPNGMDP